MKLFFKLFLFILAVGLVSCGSGGGGSSGGGSSNEVITIPGLGTMSIQSVLTSENGSDVSGSLSITSDLDSYNYTIKLQLPDSLINSGATIKYTKPDQPDVLLDECVVTHDSPSCGFVFNLGNSQAGTYNIEMYYKNNDVVGEFIKLDGEVSLIITGGDTPTPIAGVLSIVANESTVMIDEEALITVSLNDSENITTPVVVNITSSDNSIATVAPDTCNLTTQNNTCDIAVSGVTAGDVVISASATDYATVNTDLLVEADSLLIFVTPEFNVGGNYGGISGADTLCNDNKPTDYAASTFKAMIVGADRTALPVANDWVLKANTTYKNTDDDTIGTTNDDAVFDFPLSVSFWAGSPPLPPFGAEARTGLLANWETDTYTCNDWTSSASGVGGRTGIALLTTTGAISQGSGASVANCLAATRLYCVEQ